MEDIYNELEEILAKGNYKQSVSDYWDQQETANRIKATASADNDEARRRLAIVMRQLSNLFMRAVNYKYAIRHKHVDVSKQMLEKDFSTADNGVGELSAEIESSAMLLVGRAWLRSKLTYLQMSGPLWAQICRLIEQHIPILDGELTHEEVSSAEDDSESSSELKSLATSIYRYIGTYGSGLSLDLELKTQEELLEELKATSDNSSEEAAKILSEFDDVIDDAFDYDRLRARPLVNMSLISSEKNNNIPASLLDNLVPLANKDNVEQWLSEYVDSGLLKHINDETQALERVHEPSMTTAHGTDKISEELQMVDLRNIEESRKLYLRITGLPCEDGFDTEVE